MKKFKLICGPCAVEDYDICDEIAKEVKSIEEDFDLEVIFKGSFKKANRTKLDSFTTIGPLKALTILDRIGDEYDMNIMTDIHESHEAEFVSKYVDYIQIPAFLCRQTDLLIAAAKTGLDINIKKGQFMSPESMKFAFEKVAKNHVSPESSEILLTERGTTFGYNNLVVDFTSFPIMNKFSTTIMDCTHSVQIPNQAFGVTGGNPEMISTMAKAAIASGASGLFIEAHPDPSKSSSDSGSILQLHKLRPIIEDCVRIWDAIQ